MRMAAITGIKPISIVCLWDMRIGSREVKE